MLFPHTQNRGQRGAAAEAISRGRGTIRREDSIQHSRPFFAVVAQRREEEEKRAGQKGGHPSRSSGGGKNRGCLRGPFSPQLLFPNAPFSLPGKTGTSGREKKVTAAKEKEDTKRRLAAAAATAAAANSRGGRAASLVRAKKRVKGAAEDGGKGRSRSPANLFFFTSAVVRELATAFLSRPAAFDKEGGED